MSLKRKILSLHPCYKFVEGEHFVKTSTERHIDPIGVNTAKTNHKCLDCGEEHSKITVFSQYCGDGNYNTGGEEITVKTIASTVSRQRIWFQLIEGPKKGFQFPIPKYHEEHDDEILEKLSNVEEEQYYEVKFVTDNAEGTKHYCGGIEEMDIP